MNERIKELALQANPKNIFKEFDRDDIHFVEKFAELIVQECFVKLTPYMDDQFIDDIEAELKEHFGVK